MTGIDETQADGYYDEADMGDEELDLSFLDDEESEEAKKNDDKSL